MFAVLKTGGKQYKVQAGDVLRVEKLAAAAGDTVQFNEILMLGGDSTVLGTPQVDGAAVQATVIDQIKGEKLIHFVKRRRKHSSQRTKGHRQQLTLLRVIDILASGADKSGVMAAVGAGSVSAAAMAAIVAKPAKAAKVEKPEKVAKAEKPAKAAKAEKPAAKPKAEKAAKAAKVEAPAAEAQGTRPANLLTEARDGQPDNLKLISGVGPKLESLLNENGVYHFDQIIAWGADEIAYMNDKLSFKGRIERDDWIAQATTLAQG
jgi:large subunit ribosomal protein L21